MKSKQDIRQLFINISNTRGLLWPNIVEGVLFDEKGFPRYDKNMVNIDKGSLIDKIKLRDIKKITNYIIVLDYLTDYMKNKFNLTDIEISTLLKDYLIKCNKTELEQLKGETTSWIIPLNIIEKENPLIFENYIIEIVKYLTKGNNKQINLNSDYKKIKEILSLHGRIDHDILKKFSKEKKNSPTSS